MPMSRVTSMSRVPPLPYIAKNREKWLRPKSVCQNRLRAGLDVEIPTLLQESGGVAT